MKLHTKRVSRRWRALHSRRSLALTALWRVPADGGGDGGSERRQQRR